MSRDIHQTVQREKKHRDQRGYTKPLIGSFAQREHAQPERAACDKKENAGTRKIEDNADDNHDEREQPKDPTLASMANVFLSAGQDHDRGKSEKICGLVAIRKRPEAAFVMPE